MHLKKILGESRRLRCLSSANWRGIGGRRERVLTIGCCAE
jgi:hypothetical protein